MACSVISQPPLCNHPSCAEHLAVGLAEEEIMVGSWAKAEWRRVTFYGPVGRDLEVLFGFQSISPLAFEEGELFGWSHTFGPESWRLGPRFSKLRNLEKGMTFEQIKRFRGEPRRIASFRSAGGEELQILSWRSNEMPLVMVRLSTYLPLEERWQLDEKPTLRGYAVGFADFLAE